MERRVKRKMTKTKTMLSLKLSYLLHCKGKLQESMMKRRKTRQLFSTRLSSTRLNLKPRRKSLR